MISRRTVLRLSATACATSLAGCTGARRAVECRIDDSYDILELEPVTEDAATSADSVVVNYEDLGQKAKDAVVEAVATDGRYRSCHHYREGRSDVQELLHHIETQWETADVENPDDRTYLRYDGMYYGILLVTPGVIQINSLPE